MSHKKTRIVIDGEPIVSSHFSGIGHYTLELLYAIDTLLPQYENTSASVFVHRTLVNKARQYGFKNITILPSPYSQRISNGLKRRNKQPPLDLLFGKGVYVFTNYSSWPLLYSKNVSFIYDLSFELYPEFAAPPNQIFLSAETRKSAKRANLIATISQNSKKEIVDFYDIPTEKVGIYYPAVDTQRYSKRTKSDIKKMKEKYGIAGEYILFVGNIEPRKNLINLLLAYEQLPDEIREKYKLLLVGAKGWQDEAIFETIHRLNTSRETVIMPNAYVDDNDISAIYSGASAFVYPSIYEGFGIPPLEAMSCGTPIVCADNSSLPEAAGDAARFVDALSTESISQGLLDVLTNDNLSRQLVEKGFQHIQQFSWEKSARKLLDDIHTMQSTHRGTS